MVLRVVDKQRALPDGYAPSDLVRIEDRFAVPGFEGARLRRDAGDALVTLLNASKAAGYDLRIKSGFRSYSEQVGTFQYWVNLHGLEMAKRESAPPGHSEHQMGTTADLTCASVGWDLEEPFGRTPEAKWLAAHVHEFGFALSYPQNSEDVTGYVWEPWHVRYLGKECAAAWQRSGMVLVKFLEAVAKA